MPRYVVPQFNLLCNIGPGLGEWRLVNVECALVYGQRVNVATAASDYFESGNPQLLVLAMSLLLPKLTDIRGGQDTAAADQVEVPAGSGRYYQVQIVDDIGKGWPNEHRTACIMAIPFTWEAPYE
jgi:hypothetical protein